MSLHAKPKIEVLLKLKEREKRSMITSGIIAVLSIGLIMLIFGLLLLPALVRDTPVIITYETSQPEEKPLDKKSVSLDSKPRPASPSAASARVIVAAIAAPVAFEVPDVSTDFGFVGTGTDDFGSGWGGDGSGNGGAGGGGTGFGSSTARKGTFEGRLYDFKKDPTGKDNEYRIGDKSAFVERVRRLQNADFSPSALARHFQAPNKLYLTHVAVPRGPASGGPAEFGAADLIKPSGWLAHYGGRILVPKTGTYRFVASADDYLVVMIDGKIRLAADFYRDVQEENSGGWKPTDPTGKFRSPIGPIVYGHWMNLRMGQTLKIDIALAERPGNLFGFILEVEEKGVEYRKTGDGRSILPLFTTKPFSEGQKSEITDKFGSYEFDWDHVPVFAVK